MQNYNSTLITCSEAEYRVLMNKVVGKKIKQIRLEKGISQQQLAERAHINDKFLGEIERGIKGCSAFVVHKLTMALDEPICKVLHPNKCPCAKSEKAEALLKLSEGKKEKELRKAIRILEILFE